MLDFECFMSNDSQQSSKIDTINITIFQVREPRTETLSNLPYITQLISDRHVAPESHL